MRLRVPIVIGLLFAVLWVAGAGANAQPYPPPTQTVIASLSPSPSVPPSGSPPATLPPTVFPSRGPTPPPNIPFTGADLTRFVLIGAGLTAAGTGLVRLARRPSRNS